MAGSRRVKRNYKGIEVVRSYIQRIEGDKVRKIVAIIQTRMGSTRLQGKVMKELCGKTILSHDIERIKQSRYIREIVIATTESSGDDIIAQEALKNGVKVYRGSEEDVLGRYYEAAIEYNADIIVRITSDCPLIDPFVIDEIIGYYLANNYNLVTNSGLDLSMRTYPRGLDVEVFSFQMLKNANDNAVKKYQREHVTPYIYENSTRIYYYKNKTDESRHRWTLDTEQDFKLIKAIYSNLYKGKHDFYLEEILNLFIEKPGLFDINKHIEQKKVNKK